MNEYRVSETSIRTYINPFQSLWNVMIP